MSKDDTSREGLPPLTDEDRLAQSLQQGHAALTGGLLEQAADFLTESETKVADWLKSDLEFAEKKFAEQFAAAVDKTRIELAQFKETIREEAEWHTGEITGAGILFCQECGEELQFKKPGRIPPCPKCKHTKFKKHFKIG